MDPYGIQCILVSIWTHLGSIWRLRVPFGQTSSETCKTSGCLGLVLPCSLQLEESAFTCTQGCFSAGYASPECQSMGAEEWCYGHPAKCRSGLCLARNRIFMITTKAPDFVNFWGFFDFWVFFDFWIQNGANKAREGFQRVQRSVDQVPRAHSSHMDPM